MHVKKCRAQRKNVKFKMNATCMIVIIKTHITQLTNKRMHWNTNHIKMWCFCFALCTPIDPIFYLSVHINVFRRWACYRKQNPRKNDTGEQHIVVRCVTWHWHISSNLIKFKMRAGEASKQMRQRASRDVPHTNTLTLTKNELWIVLCVISYSLWSICIISYAGMEFILV